MGMIGNSASVYDVHDSFVARQEKCTVFRFAVCLGIGYSGFRMCLFLHDSKAFSSARHDVMLSSTL